MFDLEGRTARRHAPEPDLVPILDGLTSVIFFMLLSISFIGITKVTIPPSAVSASTPNNDIPVSGRVLASLQGDSIALRMEWIGRKPGSFAEKAPRIPPEKRNVELVDAVERLALKFKEKFPEEKTIQISLSSQLNYQELIGVMDGLRKNELYQDLVLSSYTEAD